MDEGKLPAPFVPAGSGERERRIEETGAIYRDRADPVLSFARGDDGRRGLRKTDALLSVLLVDIDFSWPRLEVESIREGLGELLAIRDIGNGLAVDRPLRLPDSPKAVIELCIASRLIGLAEGLMARGVVVFERVGDSARCGRSS